MKCVVRPRTFETNSSNTHTLIICPKKLVDEWKTSDKYLYKGKLYTIDEIVKKLKLGYSDDIKWHTRWSDAWTYDMWEEFGSEWLDQSEEEFTTESGDEIVILCKYGYDG